MPSLTHTQEGYFIGLTLHELANVVGAAGVISPHTRSRFNRQNDTRYFTCSCFTYRALFFRTEQERRKLHIPWFAFWFLCVVALHSFVALLVEFFKFLSSFFW
ncbi:YeiH family protein [Campylobacter upsaliensis]|nr:YeiH family protein [Campylobacter upsaliensis]MCR2107333.1 YeiH family protein [Campylobacter upsaliensis]